MHAAPAQIRESLIRRDDTFLGVCQAVGEDFGFNPVFLRIAFALPVIYAPMATIAAYLGLGLVVLLSRLLAPRPRRRPVPAAAVETIEAVEPQVPVDDQDQLPLPIAA